MGEVSSKLGGVKTKKKKSMRKTATSRASSASIAPREEEEEEEEEEERPARKSRLSGLGGSVRQSLLSLLKWKAALSDVPEDVEAEAAAARESPTRRGPEDDGHGADGGAHPFAPIHPELSCRSSASAGG
mmetsp:Transcript_30622/g.63207  ORF Transcript_30622/g.63207 Transcript_30622/m.63207 type:complete len:130 (+) Transcript_30622:76-465(+)